MMRLFVFTTFFNKPFTFPHNNRLPFLVSGSRCIARLVLLVVSDSLKIIDLLLDCLKYINAICGILTDSFSVDILRQRCFNICKLSRRLFLNHIRRLWFFLRQIFESNSRLATSNNSVRHIIYVHGRIFLLLRVYCRVLFLVSDSSLTIFVDLLFQLVRVFLPNISISKVLCQNSNRLPSVASVQWWSLATLS